MEDQVAEEQFTHMLEAMPKIAEAVKDLPPELQRQAFDELMRALTGSAVPAQHVTHAGHGIGEDGAATRRAGRGRGKARSEGGPRRNAKPKQVTATRDINFWPDGKTAFTDLVSQKAPISNYEKNLLIVWWFEEVAEIAAVGVGDVLAGYKAAGWRAPADPENSLHSTASVKHWLDTSEMKAIKTTHSGRNHVEHDMPVPEKPTPRKPSKKVTKRVAAKAAP